MPKRSQSNKALAAKGHVSQLSHRLFWPSARMTPSRKSPVKRRPTLNALTASEEKNHDRLSPRFFASLIYRARFVLRSVLRHRKADSSAGVIGSGRVGLARFADSHPGQRLRIRAQGGRRTIRHDFRSFQGVHHAVQWRLPGGQRRRAPGRRLRRARGRCVSDGCVPDGELVTG